MVKKYDRPDTLEAALAIMAADPCAAVLAGGTFLLSGVHPDGLDHVIDVVRLLPVDVGRSAANLRIGSGCTFQDLLQCAAIPDVLKAAASGMANRNIRNRATIGGNIGTNKSCSSLIPILLALEAEVEFVKPGKPRVSSSLSDWLASPEGILLHVDLKLPPGLYASSLRFSRTACDLSTSTVALAFRKEGAIMREVRIAIGGFGRHVARFPRIEALFEGKALQVRSDIEASTAPFLEAISDQRGSARYKRHRGTILVSDAFEKAQVIA